MRTKILALAAAACFISSANAAVLFSDNFETSVATPDSWATQQANPGSRTDNDPLTTTGAGDSAAPGQWFHVDKNGTPIHDIAVTSNAAPGAFEGNNYLRMHRSGDNCVIAAAFRDYNNPLTSGVVTATWEQYVPAGGGYAGGVYLTQFLNNNKSGLIEGSKPMIFFKNNGEPMLVYTDEFGASTNISTPAITTDKWQQWSLVSDLDAKTFTLTIDGVTSAAKPFNFLDGGVVGLAFNGQPGAEYYVDNLTISDNSVVPEPGLASLALVVGGALLRRRHA